MKRKFLAILSVILVAVGLSVVAPAPAEAHAGHHYGRLCLFDGPNRDGAYYCWNLHDQHHFQIVVNNLSIYSWQNKASSFEVCVWNGHASARATLYSGTYQTGLGVIGSAWPNSCWWYSLGGSLSDNTTESWLFTFVY